MSEQNQSRESTPKTRKVSGSRSNCSAHRCGFRKTDGKPCKQTILTASGRCRRHAPDGPGPSAPKSSWPTPGGPLENKHALKTGRYESILLDTLEDDERELHAAVDIDELSLNEEELRIITIRERRMLQRIAALKATIGGMILVEESTELMHDETPPSIEDSEPEFSDRWASEEPIDSRRSQQAAKKSDKSASKTNKPQLLKVKRKHVGTMGLIQQIESDLTAVQAQKRGLIDQRWKLKNAGKGDPTGDQDFNGSLWEGTNDGDRADQ